MPNRRLFVLVAGLAIGLTAALPTGVSAADGPRVYRCGNAYQAEPCAGGSAIETDAAPGADQVAAAKDVAARDRRLADAMTRDRTEREALATPSQAIGIGAAPNAGHGDKVAAKKPAKSTKKAHGASDANFVAYAPAPAKKRKKASPASH